MTEQIYSTPAKCEARPGFVHKIEPDGRVMAMTPKAAVETAAALLKAASEADGRGKLAADEAARKTG